MADGSSPHNHGTIFLLPHTTIATFPIGTFLENIAVRTNGTLLVSSMLTGEIFYIDPSSPNPQSTILKIHDFNTEPSPETTDESSPSGSKQQAEAIVEDPSTPDVFYTFSGTHGTAGTWAVFKIDLRSFNPSTSPTPSVSNIAAIPHALWLNGATFIPRTRTLLIAESTQGQLISCDIATGEIGMWLEHELLGKNTNRPPWPGVNGVQHHRGYIFVTSSDRAVVLRAQVDEETGSYVENSLQVVATDLTGDDLAFDKEGNAYIATNPAQKIVELSGLGAGVDGKEERRMTILGGTDVAETAGPTAVAFGRTDEDRKAIYVVTTGGLVAPIGEGPGLARVLRVDVGVEGE